MKNAPKYVGVEEVAKTADLSMGEVKKVFSAIVLLLRKHPEVRVRGFGRFTSKEYKARTLRLNDSLIDVRAHRVLHFNSSRQANKALSAAGGHS
jgi:nucleoid DNA-binding protein